MVKIAATGGVKLTNNGTVTLYFTQIEGGSQVALVTGTAGSGVDLPISSSPYKVTVNADGSGVVLSTIVYATAVSLQVIAGASYSGAKFSASVSLE
jgi:hypothetical protein